VRCARTIRRRAEEALDDVLRTCQQLRSAAVPSIIELAPAYTSVAVFYDLLAAVKASGQPNRAFDWLSEPEIRLERMADTRPPG